MDNPPGEKVLSYPYLSLDHRPLILFMNGHMSIPRRVIFEAMWCDSNIYDSILSSSWNENSRGKSVNDTILHLQSVTKNGPLFSLDEFKNIKDYCSLN